MPTTAKTTTNTIAPMIFRNFPMILSPKAPACCNLITAAAASLYLSNDGSCVKAIDRAAERSGPTAPGFTRLATFGRYQCE